MFKSVQNCVRLFAKISKKMCAKVFNVQVCQSVWRCAKVCASVKSVQMCKCAKVCKFARLCAKMSKICEEVLNVQVC